MSAPNIHRIFPTKQDLYEAAVSDCLTSPLPGPVGCRPACPADAVGQFVARKHAALSAIAEDEANLFELVRHAFFRRWFVAEAYWADIEESLGRVLDIARHADEPAATPDGLDIAVLLSRALGRYLDPLAVETVDPTAARAEIAAIAEAVLALDATNGARPARLSAAHAPKGR